MNKYIIKEEMRIWEADCYFKDPNIKNSAHYKKKKFERARIKKNSAISIDYKYRLSKSTAYNIKIKKSLLHDQ